MSNAKRKPLTLAEAKILGVQLGVDWAQLNREQLRMGTKRERADSAADPFLRFASTDPMLGGKVIRAYRN